jgi:hypothetical protein
MVVCATLARAQEDAKQQIKGRVTDADGKAVAAADVATMWIAQPNTITPFDAARTDADGRFTLELVVHGEQTVLMAMDAARARGGVATVAKDRSSEVVIKLAPLISVHGSFASKSLGHKPKWTNVYMSVLPQRGRVLQCDSSEATFSFKLPPGKFEFWGYGTDVDNLRKEMTFTDERSDVDLGEIDLKATIIAQHYGKAPPPIHVSDARGVAKDIALEDYEGKWLLLEFWGFW